MDVETVWETVISQMRRDAVLVREKVVAARAASPLTWSRCLPFVSVWIGPWALYSLATTVLQASACAHFSAILTLWILSVSAVLIVAARFWVRHLDLYASVQYGADRRALMENAEVLLAAVPAGRLQRRMELVRAYIEDLPPADPIATRMVFLEGTFYMALSMVLLLPMAADLLATCSIR